MSLLLSSLAIGVGFVSLFVLISALILVVVWRHTTENRRSNAIKAAQAEQARTEALVAQAMRKLDAEVSAIEKEINSYNSSGDYFGKKSRVFISQSLEKTSEDAKKLLQSSTHILPTYEESVKSLQNRIEKLKAFLNSYVEEYIKRKSQEHSTFFEGMDTRLDKQQIEAVIKNDDYNLVVAAAGSGKTTVLASRIAYLRRSGVPSERILALSFGKAGVVAMKEQLRNKFQIANIDIRTVHSLGNSVSTHSLGYHKACNRIAKRRFIQRCLDELRMRDPEFSVFLWVYAKELASNKQKPKSFEDKEKYYEYLRNQKYKTLKSSEEVRSVAERDIANFLFLNEINYLYEEPATWADKDPEYGEYKPDFTLPDYKMYIEHWAISTEGKVPDYFESRHYPGNPTLEYTERMKWKRRQFQIHRRELIETKGSQQGRYLIASLKSQLQSRGVRFRERSHKEIVEKVNALIPSFDPMEKLSG